MGSLQMIPHLVPEEPGTKRIFLSLAWSPDTFFGYISVVNILICIACTLSCPSLLSADKRCRPGMIVNTMPVPSPAAARGRVFSVDGDDCRRNCGFGRRATLLLGRRDVLLPLPSRTLTAVVLVDVMTKTIT